jgi:hypothetical protein
MWAVEVSAESAIEAAIEARDIQLDNRQFNHTWDDYHLFEVLEVQDDDIRIQKVVVEEDEDGGSVGTLDEERWSMDFDPSAKRIRIKE